MDLRGLGALLDLVRLGRDVVHLLRHPRELWSVLLQVSFAIVAIPVGCLVWAGVFALGTILFLGLSLVLDSGEVFGYLMVPWIFVSLGVAFVVLVLLYRRMPRRVRDGIEVIDPAEESAAAAPSRAGVITATDLAAIDARLAPRADSAPGGVDPPTGPDLTAS